MYGQQPPMGGPAPGQGQGTYGAHLEPHRGTLILIFGICGFAVCAIFGMVAWIMGKGDLKKMQAGTMDPAGMSNTRTGKLLGIISTVFSIVIFGLTIVGMVFYLLVLTGSEHHSSAQAPTRQTAPVEAPTPLRRPVTPPRPVEPDLPGALAP